MGAAITRPCHYRHHRPEEKEKINRLIAGFLPPKERGELQL